MTISDNELARMLYPKPRQVVAEGTGNADLVTTMRGRATSASSDGAVTVVLDADAMGSTAELEIPTGARISEGDEVLVTVAGNTPVDVIAAGWGDALGEQVESVTNYFWHDQEGAHVSTVEGDATTGQNVLIDADSMDIRDGTDVLATFEATRIYLGKNQSVSTGATIDLLNGTGILYADNWAGTAGDLHVAGMTGLDLETPMLGRATYVRMKIGDDARYAMAGLSSSSTNETRFRVIANNISFFSDAAATASYTESMEDFIASIPRRPKLLWSGSLTKGNSVTVAGIQSYRMIGCKISGTSAANAENRMLIGFSTTPNGTLARVDCSCSFDTGSASYHDKASFAISGTSVTLTSASQHQLTSSGNVGTTLRVREIWGLM